MDEFPDPEEEYENMYADEMEMLQELQDFHPEDDVELVPVPSNVKHKRSLFTSPVKQDPLNSKGVEPGPGVISYDAEKADSQKRLAEEAFDDPDIDANQDVNLMGNERKKRKPLIPMVDHFSDPALDLARYDSDLTLIDRIVAERKKNHVNEFLESVSSNQDTVMNGSKEMYRRCRMKKQIYRQIPEVAFQTMSTEEGERLYVTVMDEEVWEDQTKGITEAKKSINLLSTSYRTLRAQADKIRERLQARITSASNQNIEDMGRDSGIEDIEDSDSLKEALWVEQFKPRHYLDLLSDESTNRTVLQWVKMWDKIVFGIAKKTKKKEEKKDKEKDGKFNKFGKFNNNKNFKGPELNIDLDDQGRPMQKTLLLSGPPGLGKTTLAHVIARHAGYNVVEMNASDDRSVEMFRTKIENAISMQAVLGPDPRPNCLVIDEIDGAPAPAINYLVGVLSGQGSANKGKKGKKKDDRPMLQRPVICICNDLYTPALRPLRQLALVIQFPPTLTSKLAQRLFEISRKQKLRADLTVLMSLCEKAENDIRSCLSVLQFVRSTHHELKLADINGAAVGQKDYQRSLFNVWRDIFSIPRPKRKRRCNPHEQQPDGPSATVSDINNEVDEASDIASSSWRFTKILHTVQSCGEYDKLTQGWFENFPNMKFKHTRLDPISGGLDWATFTDLVFKEIHHSQSWLLMGYLPYGCVNYHLLFATHQRPKIQYPNQQYEANNKLTKVQNLMAAVVNEMTPATRTSVSPGGLIKDVFPYLLQIIQPNLRPVNTQLYSNKEREDLNQLINTMIGYNLTYHQEKSQEGQYAFNLDPNVEEIVRFPGVKQTGRQMPYTARQLIAREIELEKVRQAESYFTNQEQKQAPKESSTQSKCNTSSISKQPPSGTGTSSSSITKDQNNVTTPNHLQKLEAKPVTQPIVAKAPCDFFGRIVQQVNPQDSKSAINEIVKSDIWFCFKEGYSNAVRRTIRIKSLL